MKKLSKSKVEMLPDYDFSRGMRGKYAKVYAKGSNVVVLDPDVAKLFATSKVVNRLLRGLVKNLKNAGLLTITFSLFLALTPSNCAKALTAEELSHHLDVQSWETAGIGNEYILTGNYPIKNNNVVVSGKIADVKSGLLVRIDQSVDGLPAIILPDSATPALSF